MSPIKMLLMYKYLMLHKAHLMYLYVSTWTNNNLNFLKVKTWWNFSTCCKRFIV